MNKIVNIAINDLRVFLKDRSNIIFLTLVPLAMTYIIGIVNGGAFGSSSQLRVDLFDLDNSALSAQFIASLHEANSSLLLCPAENDENDSCQMGDKTVLTREDAEQRVKDGDTLALIEIPAGFGAAVEAFQPTHITYVSNDSFTAPGFIRQAVDAAVLRVNGAIVAARVGTDVAGQIQGITFDEASREAFSKQVYDRAAGIWEANPVSVQYEQTAQTETSEQSGGLQSGLAQSVPGMGSMFVMFTVFGGMTLLVVERKQWTLQRLVALPVSRAQLLGGKILSRFLLGILQYAVVFAMGILMGVNLGKDPIALILVMVSYTLAITALSFALGTQLKTEEQASGLSLLLSLALAPLGGAWWPLDIVPEFMRTIGHISPVAWAMDGFNQLTFFQGGLGDVLLPIGVLLAMSAVFFAIAVSRFKYE
ncbi:MAG: ABC transporter permease [Anaerolineaceae bacterium]|nr:ABC transporter permease [Anaerolineaceae bacterium]